MSRCGRSIVASCAARFGRPAVGRAAEPGGPTAAGSAPVTRVLVRFASDASSAERAGMRARADVERDATLAVRGLELVDPEPGVSVGARRSLTCSAWTACSTPSPTTSCARPPSPDDPLLPTSGA